MDIPAPRPTRPIGSGYHRNTHDWLPTIGGRSLEWWAQFLEELMPNTWQYVPEEFKPHHIRRACYLLEYKAKGLFLHFDEYEGKVIFTIDGYPRYGHRMRNGEYSDWQSGTHRDRTPKTEQREKRQRKRCWPCVNKRHDECPGGSPQCDCKHGIR